MARLVLVGIITLIVGGAIVGFVLFQSSQPDDVPRAAGTRSVGEYLVQEHLAVVQSPSPQAFTVRTPQEFCDNTGVWIGRQMEYQDTLLAPDSGIEMVGGRESSVPGPQGARSAHLLVKTSDGKLVSIFLQQYRAQPVTEANVTYSLAPRGLGAGAPPVLIWRSGGQTHFLISQQADALKAVQTVLGIPDPTKKY